MLCGQEGRLETDVMLAINTLTILSMCMSILCLGCLMGRVSMLGLNDLTLLLPLQNPIDAKNSSEQKFCSEMLLKLCQRGKQAKEKSRLCILDFKSKVKQL